MENDNKYQLEQIEMDQLFDEQHKQQVVDKLMSQMETVGFLFIKNNNQFNQ